MAFEPGTFVRRTAEYAGQIFPDWPEKWTEIGQVIAEPCQRFEGFGYEVYVRWYGSTSQFETVVQLHCLELLPEDEVAVFCLANIGALERGT